MRLYEQVSRIIDGEQNVSSELKQKSKSYQSRAVHLRDNDLKSAKVLVQQAMNKEGKAKKEELKILYETAAKACLDKSKDYPSHQTEFRKLAIQAIERAETLKAEVENEFELKLPAIPGSLPTSKLTSPITPSPVAAPRQNQITPTVATQKASKPVLALTAEEKQIFKMNSGLANNELLIE